MFERAHHQRIARILMSLDADVLRTRQCWFGGGTAIALQQSEFRESRDIDFLVSDAAGYRDLRQRLLGARDLQRLTRIGQPTLLLEREIRIDQYGIRGFVVVDQVAIKFEIVHEGRIALDVPPATRRICGIATLTPTDLAASKLLANADRWRDDSVFARDAIDLAFMDLPPRRLLPAMRKAVAAYGPGVSIDLGRALANLRERQEWLMRCMAMLSIREPPAAVLQRLRTLARRLDALGVIDRGLEAAPTNGLHRP